MNIYRNSNLIDLAESGEFDVIIHGCNCFHTMGKGIALQLAKKFPEIVNLDKQTKYGDINKLGKFFIYDTGKYIIVNAYTQYRYGIKTQHVDYNTIEEIFKKSK